MQRSYHLGVIRPEIRHIVMQIEQFCVYMDQQVTQMQGNFSWLHADRRREQKQRSAMMLACTGFDENSSATQHFRFVYWVLDQVPEVKTNMRKRGLGYLIDALENSDKDIDDGFPLFEVLAAEPTTANYGDVWARATFVVFKLFEIRQAIQQAMGGPEGTLFYQDAITPWHNVQIKVSPATLQFQRKLEGPLRAALSVLNECAE